MLFCSSSCSTMRYFFSIPDLKRLNNSSVRIVQQMNAVSTTHYHDFATKQEWAEKQRSSMATSPSTKSGEKV